MLTQRQTEVLNCFLKGKMAKDVAKELGITIHCVKFHAREIMKKFKAKRMSQVLIKATKAQLQHGHAYSKDFSV